MDVEKKMELLRELSKKENDLKEKLFLIKQQKEITNQELESYFKEELKKDAKFRVENAIGKITKKTIKKWFYDDNTLINVLRDIKPELIKQKLEVDKVGLKKHCEVTDDGEILLNDEILSGITIEPIDSISIKLEE